MSVESGALNPGFIKNFAPRQGETIYDKSVPGREGSIVPESPFPLSDLPPQEFLRSDLPLPQLSEPDVIRHYTRLGQLNFSIGTGPYPLGSCTMKYNPRRHEEIAALEGFAQAHPEQPIETIQGSLEVMYDLQNYLAEITGMNSTSLAPMGGAQGELTGVLVIKAKLEEKGDKRKKRLLIPDSAHGTNPATATMAGFEVTEVISRKDGNIDMDDFRAKMGPDVAGAMFTQPNTLGLFDKNIFEAAEIIHGNGGYVYGDGANMNALMGKGKPRGMGIDVMHINTHKALTTPHGGGGPGAGPVMVSKELAPFLPEPVVTFNHETGLYELSRPNKSIGRLSGWNGNVAVLLRAYSYIRTMGEDGLRQVSENAVLAANYVKAGVKDYYPIQFGADRMQMHEVVIQGAPHNHKLGGHPNGDIAKRIIDYGFHPPTISFPLIADQALMIEPTETEGLEGLDALVNALICIAQEARDNPEVLQSAPHFTPVGRLDETTAARRPILRWKPNV